MDNPWAYKVYPNKQPCYQPVVDCTYWHVLGSFNNSNIIQSINKPTSIQYFDTVPKVLIDGITDSMASLVQLGKYGATNAENSTTMGHYVIKYLSET